MKKIVGIIFLFVISSLGVIYMHERTKEQVVSAEQVRDVSIINLLANPDDYHNKKVRVMGVVNIEFEGNSLYLHKEDLQYRIYKNALWLEIVGNELISKDYNGKYVLIEGVFDKDSHGHFGMWSGSIKDISRFQLWEK